MPPPRSPAGFAFFLEFVLLGLALSLMTLLLGAAVEFTGKLSALTVEGRYQARKIQLLVAAQVVAERET